MERTPSHTSPAQQSGLVACVLWGSVGLVLAAWQGWMTLTLFAPARASTAFPPTDLAAAAWQRLHDDQPILSGRHPLHLYHGYLGATAQREQETSCCYDPAFQAGYPKTPVFDSGSRPAELFLSLAGGAYQPAAYKLGFALCLVAIPFVLFAACRYAGLTHGTAILATGLSLLACWGTPGRQLLEAGDLDLFLATLAGLLQAGLLLRFHRQASVSVGIGLLLCGAVGWYAQPAYFGPSFLLVLVYYFSVGARHALSWHLTLWGILAGGLALNAPWLLDWLGHWWIRSPLRLDAPLLPHRTLPLIWGAPLWGDAADRTLAGVLFVSAATGVWLLHEGGHRPAARVLGLGTGSLVAMTVAGLAWEPLGLLGTPRLLVPALWFAALPAAATFTRGFHAIGRLLGSPGRGAAVTVVGLGLLALFFHERLGSLVERAAGTTPLDIGLGEERQAVVDLLREHTTPEARVLWEDHTATRDGSHWSALLPLLTGRMFLGGLDLDRCIEHAYPSFTEQSLACRPIGDWGDVELDDYARRYAVGWVACASRGAVARFRAWSGAKPVAALPGGGQLFALRPPSFALTGQAKLVHADCRRLVLTDVTPDDEGKVVLSLHYQEGMRVVPSRVRVEREPDTHDPIPFVRLRLPGPVARVTLTWQGR